MKGTPHWKRAFESVAGDKVRLHDAVRHGPGLLFSFTVLRSGEKHGITVNPKAFGRAGIEEAAIAAGKWAAGVAERRTA